MKRVLLLLSGGFDSPVAAWLLLKKGYHVEAVHFSQEPFTNREPEDKARALAKHLSIPIDVVNISAELKSIADKTEKRFYFVLMKRVMLRHAEDIARSRDCIALVTGESLGQVSSQTMYNLAAIDAAVRLPVYRPLIAWDKVDIIRLAEKIGTFELSKGKEMCDVLGPAHPSTMVTLEEAVRQEQRL